MFTNNRLAKQPRGRNGFENRKLPSCQPKGIETKADESSRENDINKG